MGKLGRIAAAFIKTGFTLLFILVPLILTPWNYELFEYNKMMATYGITAIIGAGWVLRSISQQKFSIRKTPFDIPMFLFVASQLISALFSMDTHVSWFGYYSRFNGGMVSILTYTLLYYAFASNVDLFSIETPKKKEEPTLFESFPFIFTRLIPSMLITGSIVSFYGILEHFGIDKHLWVQDVQNRIFSTLGQPNWLAAYVIALTPLAFAIGALQWKKQRLLSGISFGLSIIFFITVLWTRSRSGLFAFAVADIMFWVIFLVQKTKTSLTIPKPTAFSIMAVIHIAFTGIVMINGIYIDQIDRWVTVKGWSQRLTASSSSIPKETEATAAALPATQSAALIQTGVTDSGDIRKYVWQAAINIWKSSPKTLVIGTGTETFAFAFYQYKPLGHNLTSEWDFLYNKAHNEYLNYLATTGSFGIISYCLFLLIVIIWSIKRMRSPITAGLFAGWVSILITNFFGFSVVIVQLMLFLFPALICILNTESAHYRTVSFSWSKAKRVMGAIIVAIALVLTLVSLGITWLSDKYFAYGYNLSRAGYLPQAYQSLHTAISLNPTEPMFHDEQGTVLANLALASFKEEQATIASELATLSIKESDTALSISPHNVNFWKSRTKVFYALASIDPSFLTQSIQALERGIELSPYDPKMYYNLAILYGQAGDSDTAVKFMQKAIDLKPNYREGYYGLYLLYKELKKSDLAKGAIQTYLTKVDPKDTEFLGFLRDVQ